MQLSCCQLDTRQLERFAQSGGHFSGGSDVALPTLLTSQQALCISLESFSFSLQAIQKQITHGFLTGKGAHKICIALATDWEVRLSCFFGMLLAKSFDSFLARRRSDKARARQAFDCISLSYRIRAPFVVCFSHVNPS